MASRDLRRLLDGAALVAREAAKHSSGTDILRSTLLAATDLAGLTRGTPRRPQPVPLHPESHPEAADSSRPSSSSVVYFSSDDVPPLEPSLERQPLPQKSLHPAPTREITGTRLGGWRRLDPLLDQELRRCWGCTPPLPRGAADSGSGGRAADGGLSGWATTPALGALYPWIPAQLETLRTNYAWANEGEDRVQGRAAGARVHGIFARKMEKFAGRKKSWAARRRRRWSARCLYAQQQEAVREVLLWMLPSGAGATCSTQLSPSPSSICSSAHQRRFSRSALKQPNRAL